MEKREVVGQNFDESRSLCQSRLFLLCPRRVVDLATVRPINKFWTSPLVQVPSSLRPSHAVGPRVGLLVSTLLRAWLPRLMWKSSARSSPFVQA
jgi:hypothetical protein